MSLFQSLGNLQPVGAIFEPPVSNNELGLKTFECFEGGRLSVGDPDLVPALRRMARLPEHRAHIVALPLARRIVSTTGRHQFYTVRIVDGSAVPAFKASGDITSMSQADGYIEIPAQTDIVEAGEIVDVKLF